MKTLAFVAASALTALADLSVSVASFLFVYQGDTPEELLKG